MHLALFDVYLRLEAPSGLSAAAIRSQLEINILTFILVVARILRTKAGVRHGQESRNERGGAGTGWESLFLIKTFIGIRDSCLYDYLSC
jgi:hypothetical protein